MHILPFRTDSAAANMATDWWMLHHYPAPDVPRFRHYGWREKAWTFGYSQPWEVIEASKEKEIDSLIRRPTGGGIVDHRNDWTYTLVVPPSHPFCHLPASESYCHLHKLIAQSLEVGGVPSTLAQPPAKDNEPLIAKACFLRAERYDVVSANSGQKLAGAAQKRNRHGLLFQGTIDRGSDLRFDWVAFEKRFIVALATLLNSPPQDTPWPASLETELAKLTQAFNSPLWNEKRRLALPD